MRYPFHAGRLRCRHQGDTTFHHYSQGPVIESSLDQIKKIHMCLLLVGAIGVQLIDVFFQSFYNVPGCLVVGAATSSEVCASLNFDSICSRIGKVTLRSATRQKHAKSKPFWPRGALKFGLAAATSDGRSQARQSIIRLRTA